jgi:arylsulfatase A-like enzyme
VLGLHPQLHAHRDASRYTPESDALAKEGVILDRMYTHKFCSPSRAAIQSGRAPVHVSVFNAPLSAPPRLGVRYMFNYNAAPYNMTYEPGGGGCVTATVPA